MTPLIAFLCGVLAGYVVAILDGPVWAIAIVSCATTVQLSFVIEGRR